MSRRIYLATSWRNPHFEAWLELLEGAGHYVFNFKNPRPRERGFHWSRIDPDWESWTIDEYIEKVENHGKAHEGFNSDFSGMSRSDTCVLLTPSGKSAHLEAGYMAAQGKPTCVALSQDGFEPELMYRLLTKRFNMGDPMAIVDWLTSLPRNAGDG